MAKIDVSQFNSKVTSQRQKAREDQVQNNAGGFVFQVTPWTQLRRFLILGSEGGTYYVSERKLTEQSHECVLKCIRENGRKVVDEVVEVSDKGLAPKNDPAIFVLALVAAHGDADEKGYALANLQKVCRTGTHLLHFADYVNAFRGWGRSLKRAVASWYTNKDADSLAYQLVKYQQRDGWSQRDLLRMAHPKAVTAAQDAVLRWAVGGMGALKARKVTNTKAKGGAQVRDYPARGRYLPKVIKAMEEARTADTKTLVNLIVEQNLPREAVPTEKLNELPVWEALLEKMPMTAMIRNLGKMTSIGLIKPLSDASRKVIASLGDLEALTKARIHPMALLLAAKVYEQGSGIKGSLTWTPVPALVTALEEAFYLAYGNVEPVGGPLLLALDVSGSMGSPIAGAPLTAAEATAAMSLVHLNVEADGDAHVMGFADSFRELRIRKGMSLVEATRKISGLNFGATDCSLPAQWALQNKVKLSAVFIMTDNETWAGDVHPFQALKKYRETMGAPMRQVVVATAATPFTIADPQDALSLDVVGFDASAPKIMADFAAGRLV